MTTAISLEIMLLKEAGRTIGLTRAHTGNGDLKSALVNIESVLVHWVDLLQAEDAKAWVPRRRD